MSYFWMSKYHTLSAYHNKVMDKLCEDLSDVNKLTKMDGEEKRSRQMQLMKLKIDLPKYFGEFYPNQ